MLESALRENVEPVIIRHTDQSSLIMYKMWRVDKHSHQELRVV